MQAQVLPESIAVTGATGFLGAQLVHDLSNRGCNVVALGRNLDKGLLLQGHQVRFRPVSLADKAALTTAFAGVQAVVHAGALSTNWATKTAFDATNIEGTRNVIEAAQAAAVRRLVYISTPSVQSRRQNQRDLSETAEPPAVFVSEYSRSKMAAERLVQQAELDYVILRPKAIYGPGDTALLPRIIRAISSGRLKRIGDGHATTNLTHVKDVVQGIVLALTATAASGNTYTLAGDEDVNLWALIQDIALRLRLPLPSGSISLARAEAMATLLESLWRLFRIAGEPPLTRYVVSILGYDNTYDISAARQDLGFSPQIKVEEGFDELFRLHGKPLQPDRRAATHRTFPTGTSARLDVSILNAGTVCTRERYFDVRGGLRRIQVPAMFAVLQHPAYGTVLFDTGYTPRFHQGTTRLPYSLYALATPMSMTAEEAAVSQLQAKGIAADSVRWIVLSHFHPDHYGGLKDFPNATVVCRADAWAAVAGKRGLAALRAYMLPGHLPEDLCARLHLLPAFPQAALGPFAHSWDLFGDGSIRLIDLPGHAPGHVGAWVRSSDERNYALVADAVWSMTALERPYRGLHRVLAHDTRSRDATVGLLQELRRQQPDVAIIPSHCPVTASALKLGFSR